jgi:hypothetical protein
MHPEFRMVYLRNVFLYITLVLVLLFPARASWLLVEMDDTQTDHLRAYGLAYFALQNSFSVDWLLNYKGGSFLMPYSEILVLQSSLYGVYAREISENDRTSIFSVIEQNNMDRVTLEKAPKIAVYTPKSSDPWDDAVTLVMEYARIPYDKIWNKEVLQGKLFDYDWLHLHHEDFTGQYGKFYRSFHNADWYQKKVKLFRMLASEAGYTRVADWFSDVAKMLQEYVAKGGFLFAMCAATDSLDIALAARGVDIVDPRIDGTSLDPDYQQKLNFVQSLAFENFEIYPDPMMYEFSDIDVSRYENRVLPENEVFELFEFSAKFDPIPTILTQNHRRVIKGFLGQTTNFNSSLVKSSVTVLGKLVHQDCYKYVHGKFGKGMFTFYGGHDPEDFSHLVGDPPTDLKLHRNSPGYRLILNNILFPAAKPKPRKT